MSKIYSNTPLSHLWLKRTTTLYSSLLVRIHCKGLLFLIAKWNMFVVIMLFFLSTAELLLLRSNGPPEHLVTDLLSSGYIDEKELEVIAF